LSEEVHRSVAGARFALQTVEKLMGAEHFWKMKSAKCSPHFSESSISHKNTCHVQRSPGFVWSSPRWQRCANVGRFGAMLLLCGFATGCDKTDWHRCAQESISDVATLLASGIAAGGC